MTDLQLHTPGSQIVAREQLATLPFPVSLGPRHRPVRHDELVTALHEGITDRGWTVAREQYGLAQQGHKLFGVLDLRGPDTHPGLGSALGFRSSTNQSLSIRGVAGARVFVCDNMCMSGSEFVMKRKSTTYLNLPHLVAQGLNRFLTQHTGLMASVDTMKSTGLTDPSAKIRIFNLFNRGALPLHLFDDVSRLYFSPSAVHPDCHPRTAWGLHNACTRALKVLKNPSVQFSCAVSLGREFQLAHGFFLENKPVLEMV